MRHDAVPTPSGVMFTTSPCQYHVPANSVKAGLEGALPVLVDRPIKNAATRAAAISTTTAERRTTTAGMIPQPGPPCPRDAPYVPARDTSMGQYQLMRRALVAIVLALFVLGACAGPGKKATVTGTLVMNVGLAPVKPVRGGVAATRADGSIAGQASVGADGRFKLSLSPGTYAFVGHSP